MVLHGGNVTHARDVDLLMSERDAEAFLENVGAHCGRGQPSERFYSPVYGVWENPPMPIEVFGGFQLATDGEWRTVAFSTREAVEVEGARLFVPSTDELRELLHMFGRPKDLRRAKLLGV